MKFTIEMIEKGHRFIIVRFHADGGQACIPGQRVFADPIKAVEFANNRENEPGHNCEDSVSISYSDDLENPPHDFGCLSLR